jgi:8-oxo-dGTP pyrophosphatase MutT (NUDIX family)
MKIHLLELVETLSSLKHTDKKILSELKEFISTNTFYTKKESPEVHVCMFFMPIVQSQRLVYVGHHIKADDWIPPGGHLEPEETAMDTIKREMLEELGYGITNEKIELFDVARKDIDNPKIVCKRHYDFVYLVYLEQPYDFVFDKGEFHDAKWVSFETAASMVKTPAFKSMMKYLRDLK